MINTLVLNLHILGAGFLIAVLTFAVIFLIKKPSSNEKLSNIRTIINVGGINIVWMIITGAFLFADRSQTLISSILFWVKIGLFILDLVVGLMLVNRKLKSVAKELNSQIISTSSIATWVVFNLVVTIVIIALSIMIAK